MLAIDWPSTMMVNVPYRSGMCKGPSSDEGGGRNHTTQGVAISIARLMPHRVNCSGGDMSIRYCPNRRATAEPDEVDAHALPFPSNTFDAVIAESVFAFCEKAKVSSEVYRVLKPDGVFGDNEATYVTPPPAQLRSLVSKMTGADVEVLQEDEWLGIYGEAGFEVIHSTVHLLHSTDFVKEVVDELRIDGIRRRLSALLKEFSDPTWRRTFLMDRDTRQAIRQLLSYMGCGLYVSRKP